MTTKAPVVEPIELVVFVMEVIPATFNFLLIATPPVTTSAPELKLKDSVVLVKVTSPSTFNFLSTSIPPLTINAAFVPENSVVSVILVGLLILTKLSPSALKVKSSVVDLIVFPSIWTLSTVNLAMVAAIPTFKVSVSVCPTSSSLTVPIPALKLLKVTSASWKSTFPVAVTFCAVVASTLKVCTVNTSNTLIPLVLVSNLLVSLW